MDAHKSKTSHKLVQTFLFFTFFLLFLKSITRIPQHTRTEEDDTNTFADKGPQSQIRGIPYDKRAYALKVDFASEKSGTKIIAQSESLAHLRNIQNNDRDRYMLAPCKTTDWFILSFPENIFVQQVSLLSYEDYASTYKRIRISASNYYPSTNFRVLADLEVSSSEREIFDISEYCNQGNNDCWTKYLKVELLDYHRGDNYYCTVTSMHIYGATALEVLENEIENEKYLVDIPEHAFTDKKQDENRVEELNTVFDNTRNERTLSKSIEASDKALVQANSDTLTENQCDKTLIKGTKYKFLMNLACNQKNEYNRRLVSRVTQRVSSRGKIPQHSRTQCIKALGSLSARQTNRFYRMLDHVKLPKESGWFERVIYEFVKGNLLSCDSQTFSKNAPILVCIQSPGVISKFSCFSYVNSHIVDDSSKFSHSGSKHLTCTLKRHSQWLKIASRPLLRTGIYFWYLGDNKFLRSVLSIKHFASRIQYKISDRFISSLSISDNMMTLSINEKEVFRRTKNPDGFLRYVTERLDHRLKYLKKLQQTTSSSEDKNNTSDYQEHEKSRGKKHVLLKLSERIKMVEFLSNKLSSKVFENERILNVYLTRLVDLKLSLGNFETLLDRVNEWQVQMQSEMSHMVRVWGVDQFSIVVKRGNDKFHLPGHFGGTFGRFDIHIVTFNVYEFNRNFKSKVCSIDKCKPASGRCKGVYFAHKLSIFQRAFNKYALLTCYSTFGCTCTSAYYDGKSLLLWIPHFKSKDSYKLTSYGDSDYLKVGMYNIKNLRESIKNIFNIHVLTIVFVISQIFWIYQLSRINRLLYERRTS
ncbi:hypothetical protein BEWA_001450 [Theileria equi strain WA]|uniref:SUN domain-containing protein n=1 Tax=Theileria equi strain WA TaxID=1537102 RepID=L0AZQ3_THEEQ|nr:hypothetical protein BEWA_001450 [Theileria equi strain WA]AFZ80738.1 hypothetical protein BEWA_001450 [Theileria equi strain WA]|eukprot:XP_004830404.1 hypothetical protein BEWA_001450 [Theileria equi strain WA]